MAKYFAEKYNMTQASALTWLTAVCETMTELFQDEKHISLHGFGSFNVKKTKAHNVLHPVTREPITIPERYSITFSPSATLQRVLGNLDTNTTEDEAENFEQE